MRAHLIPKCSFIKVYAAVEKHLSMKVDHFESFYEPGGAMDE